MDACGVLLRLFGRCVGQREQELKRATGLIVAIAVPIFLAGCGSGKSTFTAQNSTPPSVSTGGSGSGNSSGTGSTGSSGGSGSGSSTGSSGGTGSGSGNSGGGSGSSGSGGSGGSGSGSGSGGTGTNPGNGIGAVQYTGDVTAGSFSFKICYVGSPVCGGGVGSNGPSSTPTVSVGLDSPSAGTGTSNAVGQFVLSTAKQHAYTDALWTLTSGGIGVDSTATNFARDAWMKASLAAGTTNIEFDTYSFDDGWDWMWGTQCNGYKKIIQYDNQRNGWVDTSVPCATLYDGNWHHIQQTFHRDLAGSNNCASNTAPCEWWDTITIDGTMYAIGKSLPATTSSWQGSGGQWQLDMDPTTASSGSPATDTLYVDTDVVSAGTAATQAGSSPSGEVGSTGDTFSNDSDRLSDR